MQTDSSSISLEQFKEARNRWREQIAAVEIAKIKEWQKANDLTKAYTDAKRNQYIVQTLVDKKMRYKFLATEHVVLIGCGMYPYSLFDLHKQYPDIKSIGIEVDNNRALIAKIDILLSCKR